MVGPGYHHVAADVGESVAERIETVDRLDAARRAAVDALIREATVADGVPPVGEHKYLKLHAGDGPVRALLASSGDRLDGYAQVLRCGGEATAEVVVRPSARGNGVGRRLVAAARQLAIAEGARQLKLWAYGALAPSAAIAERHGLRPIRTLLQLERPLDGLPPRPAVDGFTIRPFDPARDRRDWLRLHNLVFAGHPENGKWSLDDLEARLSQPWFDAEDFLVAEAGGRMVGFNWLKRVPDAPPERPEGEIYIIGVDASQRGRGLGRALAILGLHHLHERGMRVCTLYVEADNTAALGLYGALGFTTRHTHRCYAIPLEDPAEEPAHQAAAVPVRPALSPCPP
jgi:mycothiol synthase